MLERTLVLALCLAACGGGGTETPAPPGVDAGAGGGAGGEPADGDAPAGDGAVFGDAAAAGGDGTVVADAAEPDPDDGVLRLDGGSGGAGGTTPDGGEPGDGAVVTGDGQVADAGPEADLGPPINQDDARLNEIDCAGRDWIEVVNVSGAELDLSGYVLTDRPDEFDDLSHIFTIPEGTIVPAGGFYAVRDREMDQPDEPSFEFGIGCGDDVIALKRPGGSTADRYELPVREGAHTWGRLPDGTGEWGPTLSTRGAPNQPAADPAPVFFDPASVAIIDLTIPPAGIASLTRDPRSTVEGQLSLTRPGEEFPSDPIRVGLHLKGRIGSFRPLNSKPGWKVDINEFVSEQRLYGLKELTLNNMVQDRAMTNQWMAYRILRQFGVAAPRVGYSYLRINGEEYGLYVNLENYDDLMYARYFSSTQHTYEGRYGEDLRAELINALEVPEGDPDDRSDLEAIVALLDLPPPEGIYLGGHDLIDWDRLLAATAVEQYIGHWDGYAATRNNWVMHVDGDGRLSIQPWGTDQTFERRLDVHTGLGRIHAQCMFEPACRDAFDVKMGQLLVMLDGMDLVTELNAVAEAIRPWVERDPRKPFDPGTVGRAQQGSLNFLVARRAELGAALECILGDQSDPDGDGYRCSADCAPEDPAINPGATDLCNDNIDQDCSGVPDDFVGCPDCVERVRGGHRYLFCPTPRSYAVAQNHCLAMGSDAVEIRHPLEDAWIQSNAQSIRVEDWWTGLNDEFGEGLFTFRTSGEPLAYTNWAAGQPDNAGSEDCVLKQAADGLWNDRTCLARAGVVCEDYCRFDQDDDEDGWQGCGVDCNDQDPTAFPGAVETCGDGVDNDCDEQVDEGEACDCARAFNGPQGYNFCGTARSRADARAACQARGGDLAIFDTAGEAVWAAGEAAERDLGEAWVGLNDERFEGTFQWTDDSEPFYSLWAPGQPDGGDAANCASAAPGTGLWQDRGCGDLLPVICEDTCRVRQDTDRDGFPKCGTDCDDGDAATYPNAPEVCGDARDQDCDGRADEGC